MNMSACTLFNEQNKVPNLLSINTLFTYCENKMYKWKRSIVYTDSVHAKDSKGTSFLRYPLQDVKI